MMFSQDIWYKGNYLVEFFNNRIVIGGNNLLDRKELENSVGFLVHLSRTFPALFPYFKGIYLNMESWKIGRSSDGWKYSCQDWWNIMAGALDESGYYGLSVSFRDIKIIFNQQNQRYCPGKVKVSDQPKKNNCPVQTV